MIQAENNSVLNGRIVLVNLLKPKKRRFTRHYYDGDKLALFPTE